MNSLEQELTDLVLDASATSTVNLGTPTCPWALPPADTAVHFGFVQKAAAQKVRGR